jgi:subtilase family serine protease
MKSRNLTHLRGRPLAVALSVALASAWTSLSQNAPPPGPPEPPWVTPPAPAPPEPPPPTVATPQLLTGHVPPEIAALGLTPIGPLGPTQQLQLAISLPLRNKAVLSQFLLDLNDPQSPNYRRFLTAQEFADGFGPVQSDYAAVIAFAKASNLTVTGTHPNRMLLDASGSVADIEQAFHVHLLIYQHPSEARQFHAPDVEPTVNLAVPLLQICGLNDFQKPRPLSGSGPGGSYMGYDFRDAYLPDASALTGSGQSVALVEFLADYYQSDITAYETAAGLPNVPVQRVQVDGYDGSPSYYNLEISLDIEMAIAMASGLNNVVVYEGIWGQPVDLLNRIATDDSARQISCSYGFYGSTTVDQIFQEYVAQGQAYLQGSGDGDSQNCAYEGYYQPNDPMEDQWITDVGGTTLDTAGPEGSYVSESVWNSAGNAGSGGGYGNDPNIPSSAIPQWQIGAVNAANQGSTTYRNFPDVALTADEIYIRFDNGARQAWISAKRNAGKRRAISSAVVPC